MGRLHCGFVLILLVAALAGGRAPAQTARNTGPTGRVTIREIKLNYVVSPDYSIKSTPAAATRNYEWLQILLDYDTEGGREGWIDEVTISWWVVVVPKTRKPILMKKSVTVVDLEQGQHREVMYIRPGFIRHYYGAKRIERNDIAVYVEAKMKDAKAVKFEYSSRAAKFPQNWWESEEPQVNVRDELLARYETPFAALDYDFYDHIKVPVRTP